MNLYMRHVADMRITRSFFFFCYSLLNIHRDLPVLLYFFGLLGHLLCRATSSTRHLPLEGLEGGDMGHGDLHASYRGQRVRQ